MAQGIEVYINDVVLENALNRVFVTVDLNEFWEEIKKHKYASILITLLLPVLESGKGERVRIDKLQEYETKSISEETKQVKFMYEIQEQFDGDKEAIVTGKLLLLD